MRYPFQSVKYSNFEINYLVDHMVADQGWDQEEDMDPE